MEDFTLKFQPVSDGYLVSAGCCLAGEDMVTISLQQLQVLEELREQLRRPRIHGIAEAVEIGRKLFDRVFRGEVADRFREALRSAREDGLRILLKFAREDPLQDLPWELMHDGAWPLALKPTIAIARYIDMAKRVRTPLLKPPIRVLFTSACPSGAPALDLKLEEEMIRQALRPLRQVELETMSNVTINQLKHRLLFAESERRPFHFWHHGGHGVCAGSTRSDFSLRLEGKGRGEDAGVEEISQIIKSCPSLLATVLNVCRGAALATALACENLPVAVGFKERIQDRSALVFAKEFYRGITQSSFETALTRARLALAYQGWPPLDWTIPLLYTRTTRAVALIRSE